MTEERKAMKAAKKAEKMQEHLREITDISQSLGQTYCHIPKAHSSLLLGIEYRLDRIFHRT